jgi:MFS family permease
MTDPTASDTGQLPVNNGYAVLRNRDFLLYLIGRFCASFGQQMFDTAIGWEIYDRTHSAFALGLVGLTQIVPMYLCSLPSGHFADNYNRKKIIVLMSAVMACANVGLAGISGFGAPVCWIYLFLFITASTRTFIWTATASFLPQLVDRNKFSRAVNWNSGTFQVSAILGPIISGAVISLAHALWPRLAHSAAPVYVLNALGALACCVLMSFIRKQHVVAVREKMTLKTLLTGFNFVFSTRIILGIISLDMFAVLLGGSTALLPVYARDILFVGPQGLGLLTAALPIGSALCAFTLAYRTPLRKAGHTLLWAVTGFGLATIGFGFSRWFWVAFAMLFICGLLDNISVTVRHTLVQMLTPDEKRGRVSAVNNLFIGTSNYLGEFESGMVAGWFGPVFSVVSGGVGTILVVIGVAFIWPEIRKYGRLDTGS